MTQTIILYDLANNLTLEKRSYSGHTQRTRFILNYKRIPYKTVWIEFADAQKGLKDLGAPPTGTLRDGVTPRYSLPTIYDPNTSKFVADSIEIAKYLDAQYPERLVLPRGAEEQERQIQFGSKDLFALIGPAFPILVNWVYPIHTERNQVTFNETMLPIVGGPPFAERDTRPTEPDLQAVYDAFNRVEGALEQNAGDNLDFSEICVLALLQMAMAITSDEAFANILQQGGGRLGKLYERAKPYMAVDEGEWYEPKA